LTVNTETHCTAALYNSGLKLFLFYVVIVLQLEIVICALFRKEIDIADTNYEEAKLANRPETDV